MGQEKWYVALPGSCDLLARAKAEPEFGTYLGFPSIFESGGKDWKAWDVPGREFCSAVRKLNEEHPGLRNRVCTLDRSYDMLHYLLSEARQQGTFDAEDWATHAIRGTLALPEHLQGGQGHPIRYSPPDTVEESASWLGGVTDLSLHEAYDPPAMEAQAVYKMRSEDQDGELWKYIRTYFEGWKAFYLAAAAHQDGVLVITT